MPAKGVGSLGREGITLLDESFCNLFDGRPSPNLPVSGRFHAGRCSYRHAAVKLTARAGLGCAGSIQSPRLHIVSVPIGTADVLDVGHILPTTQRGLYS